MPKVSVIVPIYNGSQFLESLFYSLVNQTYKDFEVIFVDDGSTDGTLETLRRILHSTEQFEGRVSSIPHKGLSAARNQGLRLARGNYIAFLDCDDSWFPNKLEAQVSALDGSSSGAVFTDVVYIYDSREVPNHIKNSISLLNGPKPVLDGEFVIFGGGSNIMCRSEVLSQAGDFDEKLAYAEDLDMWLRLSVTTSIMEIPEALVGINVRSNSMQRKNDVAVQFMLLKSRLYVYEKWLEILDKKTLRFLSKEFRDSTVHKIKSRRFRQLIPINLIWLSFFLKWFFFKIKRNVNSET